MQCDVQTIRNGGKKIVQATLKAIVIHGIHGVTHRKIAMIAEVPLGSMTYYFAGIDDLLLEAFSCFTHTMSQQYQDFLPTLLMRRRPAMRLPI